MLLRKGQVETWMLMYIVTILVIVVPFYYSLGSFAAGIIDVSVSTHNMEHYGLFSRLFYSRNGIFYEEPSTHRLQFGVIDITKLSEEHIKSLFDETSETKVAFRITVNGSTTNLQVVYSPWLLERASSADKGYKTILKKYPASLRLADGTIEPVMLTIEEAFEIKND